ncbi:hypothetical protein [Leeia oryzae]|uniref:hypothetical protein n=1 Tax=Leeia oryzae TaxID=356662 RepID=UPI0003802370|nr:hypothetical protein [Leeia oryzae]
MYLPDPRTSQPLTNVDALPASLQSWLANPAAQTVPADAIEDMLFAGHDEQLQQLLTALPVATRRDVWKAVAGLADGTNSREREDGKLVRLFAIPLVIVAGARQPHTIPALIPNPLEMRALLVEHGVMDSSNHVWMSGELVDLAGLSAIPMSKWYQAALATTLATQGFPFELPASPVAVDSRERVQLRFIVGIVVEDASRQRAMVGAPVGKWGMALSQLLQQQWQTEGLTLFVMPRALTGVVAGQRDARFTCLEVAFQLFASAIIRRAREGVGDPAAVVSIHDNAEIRVTIGSRLQPDVAERFVWPLDDLDQIESVLHMMQIFFEECQVTDVTVAEQILPDRNAEGAPLFLAVDATTAVQPN